MVMGSFVPMPYLVDVGVLEEEDVVMTLVVVSRMDTSCSTVDLDSRIALFVVVIGLSFSFGMYEWMRFLMYFFCRCIG